MDVPDRRGAAPPLADEGVDARAPHLHQRELGGHEEAVQEYEGERRTEAPGNARRVELLVSYLHRSPTRDAGAEG